MVSMDVLAAESMSFGEAASVHAVQLEGSRCWEATAPSKRLIITLKYCMLISPVNER